LSAKTKPEIPDSTQADEWIADDIFLYKGEKFKILPNCKIIPLPKNGEKEDADGTI
jgi:hypothetical protein